MTDTTYNGYMKTRLLSIDAWRDYEGWTWNNWYTIEEGIFWDLSKPMSTRRILKCLRDWGYLSDKSKGKVSIDDDGYYIVIVDRNTHEPIFALCYGEYLEI